jgi:acyl-CoA thioester hydrolase
MGTYRLERRLSHADVDFLGELKVAALLGLLEQAAVEASSAAGFDAARYAQDGRVWIIRRTRLQRHRPVGGEQTIAVETAVLDFRRARSLRRYEVHHASDLVADATTDWVYCDLQSGRPVRIPEVLQHGLTGDAGPVMLGRAAALPSTGAGPPVEIRLTVQPTHLDHVTHVNNAVYANYLEDAAFALFAAHQWPLERMLAAGGGLRIASLDCEYLSDALAGQTLIVRSWLEDPQAFGDSSTTPPGQARLRQTIGRADESAVMRAATAWVWRQRPAVLGGVPTA